MFGLFVFRTYFSFILILIFGLPLFAQAAKVYTAKVIVEGAAVYQSPDFDSKVLGNLPYGKNFEVSRRAFGPFHKIRVGQKLGYISDTDIQPINFTFTESSPEQTAKSKAKTNLKAIKRAKKTNPIFARGRFGGLSFSSISYGEETMGKNYSEALSFFGFKLSGPDIVIAGETPSEININFHYGAPSYYETATGQSASGWMFMADLQVQSVWTLAPSVMSFFGFGPMLRYSKFDLALKDPNAVNQPATSYAANDAALGAVFSLGAAFRVGAAALRFEAKYFWEKKQYLGIGSALQFQF